MKKAMLSLLLVPFLVSALFAAAEVKDEVLLTQSADSYQSVRHIVIKGTNG
jgi:hypothetical protein